MACLAVVVHDSGSLLQPMVIRLRDHCTFQKKCDTRVLKVTFCERQALKEASHLRRAQLVAEKKVAMKTLLCFKLRYPCRKTKIHSFCMSLRSRFISLQIRKFLEFNKSS